jgi:hypothetical protein
VFVHGIEESYMSNEREVCSVVLIRSCNRRQASGAVRAKGCTACGGKASCFWKASRDDRRLCIRCTG